MSSEHASIFYISKKGYCLAYDSDFEELKDYTGKKKRSIPVFCLTEIPDVDGAMHDSCYMTIEYYAGGTACINRCVSVPSAWLCKVALQFDKEYPAGIPDELLLACYLPRRGRAASNNSARVTRDRLDVLKQLPVETTKCRKSRIRKTREKGLVSYI